VNALSTAEIIKSWDTECASLQLFSNDLVVMSTKESKYISLEAMDEVIQSIFNHLGSEKKYAMVVEMAPFSDVAHEASAHARSFEESSPIYCVAVVCASLPVRLCCNFYLTIFKPFMPFRMASSIEDGVNWGLKKIKDNSQA
jgi:hypothetical protein